MDPNTRALIMGAAGAGGAEKLYVEDVFSTWLYTGNGSTQTVTNGIKLSGKGGLVWIKGRSGATGHRLTDTARGATKSLTSTSTAAEVTESTGLTAFNADGFALGADANYNTNAATYASWTFRRAAKFFDVVTYTGTGSTATTVPHDLGVTPALIITKAFSAAIGTASDWSVTYLRGDIGSGAVIGLSLNNALAQRDTNNSISENFTSTTFKPSFLASASTSALSFNSSGITFVSYLFAHNAGGFGGAGTDSVTNCGSYTGTGTTLSVDCGFTSGARFVLIKRTDSTGDWYVWDTARGIVSGNDAYLLLNSTATEVTNTDYIAPLSSGFQISSTAPAAINANGGSFIFLAVA